MAAECELSIQRISRLAPIVGFQNAVAIGSTTARLRRRTRKSHGRVRFSFHSDLKTNEKIATHRNGRTVVERTISAQWTRV